MKMDNKYIIVYYHECHRTLESKLEICLTIVSHGL